MSKIKEVIVNTDGESKPIYVMSSYANDHKRRNLRISAALWGLAIGLNIALFKDNLAVPIIDVAKHWLPESMSTQLPPADDVNNVLALRLPYLGLGAAATGFGINSSLLKRSTWKEIGNRFRDRYPNSIFRKRE